MPVRYRCTRCQLLLSITRRKIGEEVPCPSCGALTRIPEHDVEEFPAPNQQREEEVHPQISHLQDSRVAIDEVDAEVLPFRRVRSDFEEMDLTPMVDVTFLLLIFFMVTASFSLQKSIEFPAPHDDQKGAAQTIQLLEDFEDESVIVEIDNRDVVYVDDERLNDPLQLAEQLALKMRSEGKVELLLTAAAAARHETVVQVIDAANEAGMQRIRMAAGR